MLCAEQKGQTPFHLACSNGHEDIIKLLLAAQDRVNINATSLVWNDRYYQKYSYCADALYCA